MTAEKQRARRLMAESPRYLKPTEAAPVIVLIGTNRDTGKVVEVGLYKDIETARFHVHKHTGPTLYSVWTPELNSTIKAASVTGLSLPPQLAE